MGREGAAVMKTIAEKLTESGLWQKVLGKALSTGGYAGSIGLIVVLWSKAKDYIGNPLRVELKKYVQSPDYKNKVSFIERFHKDFAKIVRAYSGGKTVYVFIDDVDRCEVPKAAELMQSLNLLIANDPQLIFIIGMDREKVAAGLAVKFKELLPYLANSDQKTGIAGASGASRIHEIEYGYNFIEKFVQVPFVIPRPKEENLKKFLERIGRTARYVSKAPEISVPEGDEETGPEREAEIDKRVRIKAKPVERETARAEGVDEATETARKVEEKAKREEGRMRFDQEFNRTPEIVLKVNPALESNPRRVKQFINLFRLWAYIAITTGVIDPEQRSWKAEDWTFEKLGKLIAVRLRWPLFLSVLDKAPEMLGELEQAAWRPAVRKSAKVAASNISQWIERQELMELLRAGCFREKGKADTEGRKVHSVGKLDLGKLLLVSPRIRNLREEMKGTEIEMEKILTEPGGRSLVSILRKVLRSGAEST
jgi:hypothetical protein